MSGIIRATGFIDRLPEITDTTELSDSTQRAVTTDKAPTTLLSSLLDENCSVMAKVQIIARNTGNSDTKIWDFSFFAKRIGPASPVFLSAANVTLGTGDLGAALWAVTLVDSDSPGNAVLVKVQGDLGASVVWLGKISVLTIKTIRL